MEIVGVIAEDLTLRRYAAADLERCLTLLPALDARAYRLRELVPAVLAKADAATFRERVEGILQGHRTLAAERRPDGREAAVVGTDGDEGGFFLCLRERRICDGREHLGSVVILRTVADLDAWQFTLKQPDLPLSGAIDDAAAGRSAAAGPGRPAAETQGVGTRPPRRC